MKLPETESPEAGHGQHQNEFDRLQLRFQYLIDGLTDACFGIDFSWRYIFFNSTAELITGLERKEVLGKDIRDLFPDIVQSSIFKEYQRVMSERVKRKVTGTLTLPDGRKAQFSIQITPIPEGIMCVVKEINERVMLLEELKESEAFLLALLNAPIEHAILVADHNGQIVFANDAVNRLFQYERKDLANQHINLLIPVEVWESLFTHKSGGAKSGQTCEAMLPRKNDNSFPGFIHIYQVYDRLGLLMASVVFVQDLTSQKEIESRRLQATRFRAIAELTKDVAHNFNNLLGSIMGCTQMLELILKDSKETKAPRLVEQILASGGRMTKLVQDMLTITGMMDSISVHQKKIKDLDGILREAVIFVQSALDEKKRTCKIVIKYEPFSEPPLDYLTESLRTAIVQILLNGIEAMEKDGAIEIKGEWPAVAPDGSDKVLIRITDHGRGMDDKTLERAVDPLFSTKKKVGVGIGLTTAYGIINRIGGTLKLDSELGKGTTVKIWLPGPNENQNNQ